MTPIHWPEEQLSRLNALGEFVQYQVMEYTLPVRETKRTIKNNNSIWAPNTNILNKSLYNQIAKN